MNQRRSQKMRVKISWSECIKQVEANTNLSFRTSGSDDLAGFNKFFKAVFYNGTHSVYNGSATGAPPDLSLIELNEEAREVFYEYFLPFVYSSVELYAFSYEDDFENDEEKADYIADESSRLFGRIFSYLKDTQEYYSPILEAYETMRTKLFDEITRKEGVSLMPQSSDMSALGGTQDDLSKAIITKDDGGTAMARLNEVQLSYRALYQEWAEDMKERFALWR